MFDWFRKPKTDPRFPPAEDNYDRAVFGDIERVGWSVLQINPEDPETEIPFSYSLGLFHSYRHPEIILLGLPHEVAGTIINGIGVTVASGERIEPNRFYDDFTNTGNVFKVVDPRHYPEYCGYALWFYHGDDFPVLQCVWPLKSGQYPWDEDYPPEGAEFQPLLAAAEG